MFLILFVLGRGTSVTVSERRSAFSFSNHAVCDYFVTQQTELTQSETSPTSITFVICKGTRSIKKINHLLPLEILVNFFCKAGLENSYGELVSSVCHEHHHHYPNNLQIECVAFCVSGLVMGFLLWEVGFRFCKMASCFRPGVTLKGLRGVANTVAVEESCVLDVKSRIVLIIFSGRVLVFTCSLKARYLFCVWRYRLAFSSSRLEGHFKKAHRPYCPVSLA